MTRYVLLKIDDHNEADDLLLDMANWSDDEILTPVQENRVYAKLVTPEDYATVRMPLMSELIREQCQRQQQLRNQYDAEDA